MTKENVINIIRHVFHYYDEQHTDYNWSEFNEACGIVIDLLENNKIEEELENIKTEIINCFSQENDIDSDPYNHALDIAISIVHDHITELKGE